MDELELKNRIDAAMEKLSDELTNFAVRFFSIPTQNPPGYNYDKVTQCAGEEMKKAGMEITYLKVPDERLEELAPQSEGHPRINVIGTKEGQMHRPLLHITGHYDVVPEGTGWTHDPYACDIEDGKIYARGSADQKSGIVSEIFAARILKEACIELKGTLLTSATADEETGGFAGVGYMVEQGYFTKESTDYAVITECLDVDKVCLGHRGTMWFEIEITGKQAHGSMPSEGVSPIEFANRLMDRIDSDIQPLLKDITPLPVQPPACRKSTLTVTMLRAGEKLNTIPQTCTMGFDWRLNPELSVKWAEEQFVKVCEAVKSEMPGSDYKINMHMATDPTLVPNNTDVVKAFLASGKMFLGRDMEFSISPGEEDQKFIIKNGHLDQCIVYGPGRLTLAHKSDEYAVIEEMKTAAKVMALSACKLLGTL